MQAFLVKILIAALMNPDVQAALKSMLTGAVDKLSADIQARIGVAEANLFAKLESLPATLLGDAAKPVDALLHEITGTTDDIAGAVKGQVQPLLPTADSLQTMLTNVLRSLPGGGILGGILGRETKR